MNITGQNRNLPYVYLASGLASLLIYIFMGYYSTRADFSLFITLYMAAVGLCFLLLSRTRTLRPLSPLKWGLGLALLFRLVLFFAEPTLSDDFYRFIWDGNLFVNGINPFLHTPESLVGRSGLPFPPDALYSGLNSVEYYSVYPAVCQYIFAISAFLFGEQVMGNILFMRGIILLAEIGSLWCLYHLLKLHGLNKIYLLIYALNPLVILELTGNLHFEAISIFFLLFALLLFHKQRYLWAALAFTVAVNTKLIPLLLMPYLLFSLGWRKGCWLAFVVLAGSLALHLPFLGSAFLEHFSGSLGLYFQTFEFNAGIYYLVRWAGYYLKGYNIIQSAGPILAAIATVLIMILSWRYRDSKLRKLPTVFIYVTALFYLFSTTVHPWYVTSLLAFVPLCGLLFPLAWSAVIPLSYIAYSTTPFTENMWLIAFEYAVVCAFLYRDWKRRSTRESPEINPLQRLMQA